MPDEPTVEASDHQPHEWWADIDHPPYDGSLAEMMRWRQHVIQGHSYVDPSGFVQGLTGRDWAIASSLLVGPVVHRCNGATAGEAC